MSNHAHHHKLFATVAMTVALAGAASPALAMPIDRGGSPSTVPEPDRVKVVRVQVDEGMDWSDAGIGAAGMFALVLVGFGGAHVLRSGPARQFSARSSGARSG